MPAEFEDFVTRFLPATVSKVDVADEKRLTGYAIVFNSLSENLGGFRERILPEAVDRTLRQGTNVYALLDHKMETTSILGSTDTGLLRLKKDRHGLAVDVTPPDTSSSRDLITVMKAGLVKGMSFRYKPIRPGGMRVADEESPDGLPILEITDMTFREVSFVLSPAYLETEAKARNQALDAETMAEIRSLTQWKPSLRFRERVLRARAR